MKKFKALIIGLMAIFILTAFSGCSLTGGASQSKGPEQKLVIWGLFDDLEVFDPIVKNYKIDHPDVNLTVYYEKKTYDDYIETTVNSLAAKNGPDIWLIRNDWMPRESDKLVTMPEKLMSTDQFKRLYPQVAVNDLIIDNKIYGLPLSIDTLALYYNTAIFSQKRNELERNGQIQLGDNTLSQPPGDWDEFIKYTKLLTAKNTDKISQAGAALGTSNNIDASADILSVLMLQNHAKMVSDDKKSATFNLPITKQSGESYYAGTKALEFYNSFSDPTKEAYSWNSSMPNSIDAFAQGKLAMMINYGFVQKTLYNLAPTLQYNIGPLPQIKDAAEATDYASYWAETVTNNAKNPDLAWDFVNYLCTKQINSYLSATKRPSPFLANKDQVPNVKNRVDNKGSTFIFQLFSAEDWYKGQYPQKVDTIFQQMITNVINGQPLQNTIDAAASDVTTLLRK